MGTVEVTRMCILADELKRVKTSMTDLNYENKRLLDVVNENDEIIDSKSREDIHRLGLIHRQVHVWMFDENKNLFLQKRGFTQTSAGLLDATVGGHVNKGENYIDAAIRETREETGMEIKKEDLYLIKKVKNITNKNVATSGKINNYIQEVYIYKHPIVESNLRKEQGIPGGSFQKLSYKFLTEPEKEYIEMFHPEVYTNELSSVLDYIK